MPDQTFRNSRVAKIVYQRFWTTYIFRCYGILTFIVRRFGFLKHQAAKLILK